MECIYHRIIERLNEVILEEIDCYHNWAICGYRFGNESVFGKRYINVFEEILETQLSEENRTLIKIEEYDLDLMIAKWCAKWRSNRSMSELEKVPINCLKLKIYEYIFNQMNKPDIIAIIGVPC
jgi:hypothetical protein